VFIEEQENTELAVSAGDPRMEEEVAWVRLAKLGDVEAYGKLVDRYQRRVYGIAYRMCGAQDAEDLTQEVFVKALVALRSFQFKGAASFRTWLYRIAVNAAINELRRRKRRRVTEGPSLDAPVAAEDGDMERDPPDKVTPGPVEVAERNEVQAAVHAVLAQMRPAQRLVLVLVDLEGMEYREAARTLNCPLGTLKSRVARARDSFARRYEEYQFFQTEQARVRRERMQGPGAPPFDDRDDR